MLWYLSIVRFFRDDMISERKISVRFSEWLDTVVILSDVFSFHRGCFLMLDSCEEFYFYFQLHQLHMDVRQTEFSKLLGNIGQKKP